MKQIFRVPANKKELRDSPERTQWEAADRKALDCILRVPGNRLVHASNARARAVHWGN